MSNSNISFHPGYQVVSDCGELLGYVFQTYGIWSFCPNPHYTPSDFSESDLECIHKFLSALNT